MHHFKTLLKKIAEEEKISNSFCEAAITLIPKPAKIHQHHQKKKKKKKKKKKLQVNTTDEYKFRNPQQNASSLNPTMYQKDYTLWSSGSHPRGTRIFFFLFNIKSINVMQHFNKLKYKNDTIISTDT